MTHARVLRARPAAMVIGAGVLLAACSGGSDGPAATGDSGDVGSSSQVDGAGDGAGFDDDSSNGPDPAPDPASGGAGGAGAATRYGTVGISRYRRSIDADVSPQPSALFFRSDNRPYGDLDFVPRPDTCRGLDQLGSDDQGSAPTAFDGTEFQPISAGETILISSAAGTYTTLIRQGSGAALSYANESGSSSPVPVPDDLVLDIPGDEFPAFAGVAIPPVEALSGVTLTGSIDSGLVFGWDAGGDPEGLVEVTLTFTDPADSTLIRIRCDAADDGAFEFPAAARDAIPEGPDGRAILSREARSVLREGDAVLIVGNKSIVAFSDRVSSVEGGAIEPGLDGLDIDDGAFETVEGFSGFFRASQRCTTSAGTVTGESEGRVLISPTYDDDRSVILDGLYRDDFSVSATVTRDALTIDRQRLSADDGTLIDIAGSGTRAADGTMTIDFTVASADGATVEGCTAVLSDESGPTFLGTPAR